MSWLFQENWPWLLVSALLGAAVTLFHILRRVTVSTVRSHPVAVELPEADLPAVEPADEPDVDGSYAGSAAANPDRSQPPGYPIKGSADSRVYHTVESPYYGRTIAEVWFDSEVSARSAGFTRWNERKRESAGPAGVGAVLAAGAFGAGSADPVEGGASPHESFTIKGNAESMLFYTVESPYYGRTIADVWFDSEDAARTAGFRRWDERD